MMKFGGSKGEWHRWATAAVLSWNPSADIDRIPLIQIHGERDSTFPIRYTKADIVVRGARHCAPMTHSGEIASVLQEIMLKSETNTTTQIVADPQK